MADKFAEERVRVVGARLEFGVELHADKEIVVVDLHRFAECPVGRKPGKRHARLFELLAVVVVEFEAVAVAFADGIGAVGSLHLLAVYLAGVSAEAHRAAHLDAVLIGH